MTASHSRLTIEDNIVLCLDSLCFGGSGHDGFSQLSKGEMRGPLRAHIPGGQPPSGAQEGFGRLKAGYDRVGKESPPLSVPVLA